MDQNESMPSKRILECWGCGEPAPPNNELAEENLQHCLHCNQPLWSAYRLCQYCGTPLCNCCVNDLAGCQLGNGNWPWKLTT